MTAELVLFVGGVGDGQVLPIEHGRESWRLPVPTYSLSPDVGQIDFSVDDYERSREFWLDDIPIFRLK